MSIRNVLLFTLLLTLSLFALACQKHDHPVAPQVSPKVQPIGSNMTPQAQIETLPDNLMGIATPPYQLPPFPKAQMNFAAALSTPFYDPLDGATLGFAAISGYEPGYLGLAAILGGEEKFISYTVGAQIPTSGAVEFYLKTAGYQPAYNYGNIIFTQCGYGNAARGDIHLALSWNGSLAYGQWAGPWWPPWSYIVTPPLPLNQWVKIRAEFGSSGRKLFFNDQLVASTTNSIPISASPFYFGTRSFLGRPGYEYGVHGLLDEIRAFPDEIAEIKIKNLDAPEGSDPFADNVEVSYRAAKTRFQAIEFDASGIEIGPVTVDWHLDGGDRAATEPLRAGILHHLGQPILKIANLDNATPFPVIASTTVTFNSFLPGNITLVAKKGPASGSVAIRIKKPVFKVSVYPVGDVDTSIFATWEGITRQVWEKEGIIKIESITMQSPIPNVTFPDSPLAPPYQGAEASLTQLLFGEPNLLNPLVYDCLLGHNSGFFNVPRQSGLLLASREPQAVNVFHVFQPWSYFVLDRFTTPPTKDWYPPEIYAISSREHFVILEVSGAIIESFFNPYPIQYSRFLAAGVGRVFGLVHAAEWLGNLMDFSPIGGFALTPEQYITALNYRNDNPQNLTMIWEE